MAITVTHSKVSTIPDGDDSSLIRPSDWNDDHVLDGLGTMAEQDANAVAITGGTISGVAVTGYVPTTETITAGTGLTGGGDLSANRTIALANTAVTTGTYGTASRNITQTVDQQGRLTNIFDQPIEIANTQVTGLGTASTKDAGAALGVATLDSAGKVPISQIPDSVIGALSYQGTWNATTNTPTLTSSIGIKGYYYVVSVAGTTNLNGITDWQIGDWAVFDGLVWEKIDNTDGVTSVNGFTGAVVLTTTNIAEGTNEYYTDARARAALSAGTGISYNSTTGVITNSSPSLGGDVVGPASATDNAIARFDTTTGKLIQNSVVTVSDTGAIAGATTITNLDYLDFDTTYNTTLGAGQLGWNGNDTLGLGMIGGNVVQHIGEDTFYYVKASATITKGQVIMFTGALGASGVILAAPSTGVTNPNYIMGIAAESIANNAFGLIQAFGVLRSVDTQGFADGDVVYYNSAVTGGYTATYPTSGPIVIVGAVVNGGSAGGGVLQIRVSVTQRMTASTGISVSQNGTGTTITNSAPDQVVSITGAGGAVVTGTYPSFTVTTPSGTVTSVTGTAPIASSGGATPAISISQSSGSTDGYLSSTDWTTFNSKQPAGTYVNSVSATSPITSSGGTTPTIAMPAATGSVNGYLTSTDWTTFNSKGSGTVTSVGGTGTVSGISLSGTVTSSGNLTLGGTLDLSSPPAIGGTAPNTVNGTVINATNGIVVNSNTVSASYTIPSGSSAMSAGPMTVASGQTVTVSSGSRWVVL